MDLPWLLWPIAVLMACIIALLVKWSARMRTAVGVAVILFLLWMMVAMLLGAFVSVAYPGANAWIYGLWIAAGLMSISVFPVVWVFVWQARLESISGPTTPRRRIASTRAFAGTVVGLVLLNELVMGRTFQLVAGASVLDAAGLPSALAAVVATIEAPWFAFPMALEMALTVYLLRAQLPGPLQIGLAVQAATMFLSPPAIASSLWVVASSVGSNGLMLGWLVYFVLAMARSPRVTPALARYFVSLVAVYAVMSLGLVVWILNGSGAVFAVSVVLQMVVFFSAVVVPEAFDRPADEPSALSRPAPPAAAT